MVVAGCPTSWNRHLGSSLGRPPGFSPPFFCSKEKCLVKLDTPAKVFAEQSMVDHNSIGQVMVGIFNLEQLMSQKMFTRAEVKHLMEVIDSRSIESMKSKAENNDQSKGSFIQEDKTSPYFGLHGAKTLDPSISPNFVESLAEVPMVPIVPNLTIRPQGKAAICRMARSPYFMTDPLTKMKRGREFRWNAGGGPSLSRGISRRNLKSLGNQALKRDASFLDDDADLLGPICKIPKKSIDNDYNEEPIAKDESPGDAIVDNNVNGAFIYSRSDMSITKSMDSTMSSHDTPNLRANPYFRMFALEYSSSQDEEDDTTNDSTYDSTGDSVQSPLNMLN